ncbi:hypothetical protein [Luteolibacter soli]|uniref:DUF1206 domain-containing protein n=1 Tax=Luteolibacter soli TaxID=3135280 RepID=A0ABU9B269_9BACT
MSVVSPANPAAFRNSEKLWFRWAIVCAVSLCLGVVTWGITAYLTNEAMNEISAVLGASSDLPDPDFIQRKAAPIKILAMTTSGLLLAFGAGFLFCFVRWLLAIRRRRAAEAFGMH